MGTQPVYQPVYLASPRIPFHLLKLLKAQRLPPSPSTNGVDVPSNPVNTDNVPLPTPKLDKKEALPSTAWKNPNNTIPAVADRIIFEIPVDPPVS